MEEHAQDQLSKAVETLFSLRRRKPSAPCGRLLTDDISVMRRLGRIVTTDGMLEAMQSLRALGYGPEKSDFEAVQFLNPDVGLDWQQNLQGCIESTEAFLDSIRRAKVDIEPREAVRLLTGPIEVPGSLTRVIRAALAEAWPACRASIGAALGLIDAVVAHHREISPAAPRAFQLFRDVLVEMAAILPDGTHVIPNFVLTDIENTRDCWYVRRAKAATRRTVGEFLLFLYPAQVMQALFDSLLARVTAHVEDCADAFADVAREDEIAALYEALRMIPELREVKAAAALTAAARGGRRQTRRRSQQPRKRRGSRRR